MDCSVLDQQKREGSFWCDDQRQWSLCTPRCSLHQRRLRVFGPQVHGSQFQSILWQDLLAKPRQKSHILSVPSRLCLHWAVFDAFGTSPCSLSYRETSEVSKDRFLEGNRGESLASYAAFHLHCSAFHLDDSSFGFRSLLGDQSWWIWALQSVLGKKLSSDSQLFRDGKHLPASNSSCCDGFLAFCVLFVPHLLRLSTTRKRKTHHWQPHILVIHREVCHYKQRETCSFSHPRSQVWASSLSSTYKA